MQTGKGNKKKKGKGKGEKRQARSQADIVWGGPTTGGYKDQRFLQENDREIIRRHFQDDKEVRNLSVDDFHKDCGEKSQENLKRDAQGFVTPCDGRTYGWFEAQLIFEERLRRNHPEEM